MRSTGEMLCAGILPINQMRDYFEPAAVVSSRVPEHLLNAAYGMKIKRELDFTDRPDRPPTASEMLCALCAVRGYITNGTGRWDEFRACKEMLRDFNDGRILFVAPPPQLDEESGRPIISDSMGNTASDVDMERWLSETEKVMVRREKVAERIALQRLKEIEEENERERLHALRPQQQQEKCEMVFGDIRKGEEFQFYDDEDDDVEEEEEDYDEGEGGDEFDERAVEGSLAANLEGVMISPSGHAIPRGSSSAASVSNSTVTLTAHGVPKREHKRLKHWGKKNKKLRDKNPYGEDNGVISYEAYSTNRQLKKDKLSTEKVHRQDPRHAYGEQYTRAVYPHQESLQATLKGPQRAQHNEAGGAGTGAV
jgi:hypothetical protein